MGDDLAAYGLDTYHHYETRVLRRKMNWKLAVDTFGETYHLQHLHPDTVSPLFHSNRCTFAAFGPNHRMLAARRSFDELRGMPEHEWDVFDHTVVICVLFPNTVFTFQRDHVETWHFFPGDSVDETVMYVSLYIPEPVDNPKAKQHWDNNFNLLMATVEMQDFPTCEGMQRGFASGGAGLDRVRPQRAGAAALPPQHHRGAGRGATAAGRRVGARVRPPRAA